MQAETKVLNVCVTGAAGQIGYSFLPLLCTGTVFGNDTKINLRLLDIQPAEKALQGVAMELADGAYPLLDAVTTGSDPEVTFKDCDVVVFIGGFPRKQGMLRKELLTINGKIFKGQGAALDKVAKKTCKCVVVANPANTNCLLLRKNAPSIPSENFSALTRLDQNRALSQLAGKAGKAVTEVSNAIIWGNHSATQYPDANHGTISGEPIRKVINDDEYLNDTFITKVQKRGAEIIDVRGGSSVFSAANAVKDHLRDWYLGTKEGVYSSMAVVSDGSYNVPKDIVFSFPVKLTGGFKYEIVQGLKIDEFSQKKLDATAKELQEEEADAFGE